MMRKLLTLMMGMTMMGQGMAATTGECGVVSTNVMSLGTDEYRVVLTNIE
jgi:hypothetical protein